MPYPGKPALILFLFLLLPFLPLQHIISIPILSLPTTVLSWLPFLDIPKIWII